MGNDFQNGFEQDFQDTPELSRPRAGTIIWGLTAIAVGLLVLAGLWWSISLNLGYVLIAILIGSGLALVAAGILNVLRGKAGGEGNGGGKTTETWTDN
ncbi:hypothetical protein ACFQ36_12220 [Arthrobacter sp. GCM10027362]|uniref:hypothetical protein n=1 Tax=Arthrobacter sp. GCM10027362 TaxID=3273379 RepID=UPI0036387B78